MADLLHKGPRLPSDHDLLEHAACGIALTDTRGLILKANHTLCTWLGVDRSALVGVRRIQDLLTMGGRIFHQTHWAPLLQMQGSISEVKLDLLHGSGDSVPMVMNAIRRQHGEETFHELTLAVAQDRHRYEQELINARKRAEELVRQIQDQQRALRIAQEELSVSLAAAEDRAKFAEQLVGIVSHDLRNPLGAIQLSTTALLRLPSGGEKHMQAVERIDRSVRRATSLIGDLLDFTQARVGSGISVHPRPFDLHDCVARAVVELRSTYPSVRLEIDLAGAGQCCGDGDRLAQALGNLVSNAVTYGSSDQPIRVMAAIEIADFAIEVHNFGRPIPQEVLPTLFEPMKRGSPERPNNKSVGLGLFIVHEIVAAHRGRVLVASSEAGGTSFRLEIPRLSSGTG